VVEFITLLPFVIPAIVLVFGIIKTFGKPVTLFGDSAPALAAQHGA
jgi:putative spermidine/putrescine transport system permease protein